MTTLPFVKFRSIAYAATIDTCRSPLKSKHHSLDTNPPPSPIPQRQPRPAS